MPKIFSLLILASLLSCTSSNPGKRKPSNVFGESNRKLLHPSIASEYPWRAVGRLQSENKNYCTATLIAEDLILTAAHCFFNLDTGEPYPGRFEFMAGYADGKFLDSAKVLQIWPGTKKIKKNGNSKDWAIARLSSPIGGKLGFYPPEVPGSYFSLIQKPILSQVAYHYDLGDGNAPYIHEGCRFMAQINNSDGKNESMLCDCDATEGASGSGIFIFDENLKRYSLIGIFVFEFGAKVGESKIGIPFLINDANEVIQLAEVKKELGRIRAQR